LFDPKNIINEYMENVQTTKILIEKAYPGIVAKLLPKLVQEYFRLDMNSWEHYNQNLPIQAKCSSKNGIIGVNLNVPKNYQNKKIYIQILNHSDYILREIVLKISEKLVTK